MKVKRNPDVDLPTNIYFNKKRNIRRPFNVMIKTNKLLHVGNYSTLLEAIDAKDFALRCPDYYMAARNN